MKFVIRIKEHLGLVVLLLLTTLTTFWPLIIKGQVPFPGDILLGNYHPWKDVVWMNKITGYPVKNIELSDALTQYYPFKQEIIKQLKQGRLPNINQYIFSGTPLLADGHSGALYPLNLVFWLTNNFSSAWSIYIMIQPILAGLFFYIFLRSVHVTKPVSCFGSLIFAFNSYYFNQVEFGTAMHTLLWIPLSLFALNKMEKKPILSLLLLAFSLTMSFFAGFVQFFAYHLILAVGFYLFVVKNKQKKIIFPFLSLCLFIILSLPQLIPWLKLLPLTARWKGIGLDENVTAYLIQPKLILTSIAPDFFGSPVTMNWFGSRYHYYEFVIYCGCLSIILIFFVSLKDRLTRFFLAVLLISLILSLDTPFSRFLYKYNIPVFSSLIPARILSLTVVAISFLSSYGLANIVNNKYKPKKLLLICFLSISILSVYLLVGIDNPTQRMIAFRNTVIPGILTGLSVITLLLYLIWHYKLLVWILIILNTTSLVYQGKKFNSFIPPDLIFPETATTLFLKDKLMNNQKMLSVHQEVFPVNVNMVYGFTTPNGYHPVHLTSYNEFIAKMQFPDIINPAFGRTIFLTNITEENLQKTNVRFILTIEKINYPYLKEVFTEGKTKVFEYLPKKPHL
ncbi:MAG TPA: hypothetical protein VMW41_03405 [Candidatus Bathyarchaeia archaeon]|nr:hypothetical protein [Candidatus Bathyarchaeia archaeon]